MESLKLAEVGDIFICKKMHFGLHLYMQKTMHLVLGF